MGPKEVYCLVFRGDEREAVFYAVVRADFDLMYGIAEFLWGAVLGERSAAWLFQASDEQRRNGPQRNSATNNIQFYGVAPKCGPRVVALLAKAISISRVATPSGNPHLGATIPYIKSKSALVEPSRWRLYRKPHGKYLRSHASYADNGEAMMAGP